QRLVARDPDEAIDLVEEHLRQRPREQVYDDLLVPGLVLASRDRERGVLTEEDEEALSQQMRRILEEADLPPAGGDGREGPGPCKGVVLGCPAGDGADELGLEMLRQLAEAGGCRLEVM